MIRTLLLLVVALVIAALAALNWTTLSTNTDVSLGVTTVQAPLGLIMLALTVILAIFFVVYVLYLQSTVLLETRRHGRELQAQRELADKAEASRFTELRAYLETQEQKHGRACSRAAAGRAGVASWIRSDNTIAAHIGQLEDRLERRPLTPAANTMSSLRRPPPLVRRPSKGEST